MHFNLSDSTDKCDFVVVEFGWLKLFKYIRKGQLFNSTSYTTISISKWLQLKYGLQDYFGKFSLSMLIPHVHSVRCMVLIWYLVL